jgi:hypothetical protein
MNQQPTEPTNFCCWVAAAAAAAAAALDSSSYMAVLQQYEDGDVAVNIISCKYHEAMLQKAPLCCFCIETHQSHPSISPINLTHQSQGCSTDTSRGCIPAAGVYMLQKMCLICFHPADAPPASCAKSFCHGLRWC